MTGLRAHARAMLGVRWRNSDGLVWSGSQPVRADADGRAVLTQPHWLELLRPPRPDFFFPAVVGAGPVRLTLREGGRVAARAAVQRDVKRTSVRVATLRGPLHGRYFATRSTRRRAAVLVIGGSDGGEPDGIAALIASHGYPALALDYFRGRGLPRELSRIPLEYFGRALRWLGRRRGVDARQLVVYGISRGGEGALLIGATFPRLVHGVIALVPSDLVNGAFGGVSSWTRHGRDVPPYTPIAVQRIDGPILVASAGDDARWSSSVFTQQIEQRLAEHRFRFAHQRLDFAHAGHDVGTAVPYLPQSIDRVYWGGTRTATAAARVVLWRAILRYLRSMSSTR